MQGRIDEARSLFDRLLGYASRLGLFSEEIDSHKNIALGNYPQAFTHIALINSAYNLRKAEMRMAEHHTDPVLLLSVYRMNVDGTLLINAIYVFFRVLVASQREKKYAGQW